MRTKRPDWLPDDMRFQSHEAWACDCCGKPATSEAWSQRTFDTGIGVVFWCDSPACESAARTAICGSVTREERDG